MTLYRIIKPYPDAATQKRVEWVASLMAGAENTAAKLGVSPEAIVAQAALETGWGKSAIGHNLFGIKAAGGWTGKKQLVRTREVINGESVMIDDWFRDYDSYQDSVDDHFRFLTENSRYRAAGVFSAGSDEAYFAALQRAGYATDPNYASVLTSVLKSVRAYTANMERIEEAAPIPEPVPPAPAQKPLRKSRTFWTQILQWFGGLSTVTAGLSVSDLADNIVPANALIAFWKGNKEIIVVVGGIVMLLSLIQFMIKINERKAEREGP